MTAIIRADFWGHARGVIPAATSGGDVVPANCIPAFNFGGDGPDAEVDARQCPGCTREKQVRKPLCPDCFEAAQL